MNDPELKAMSTVYDALQSLDADTRQRVTDWVLAKLKNTSGASAKGAKRGRKPGSANVAKASMKKAGKRGRPAGSTKKSVKTKAVKKASKGRGRPRKAAVAASA